MKQDRNKHKKKNLKRKTGSETDPVPEGIWFPAKRYGYGWGAPVVWQGWVVLVTYVLLLVLVAITPATQPPLVFFSTVALLTATLVVVCSKKGVKPRWRWGDDHIDD